jgi:hypothetical protein
MNHLLTKIEILLKGSMDIMPTTEKSVAQEVAHAIAEYTSKDGKSLRQIELYTHVSYSYIRRLSLNDIDEQSINPLKLFPVLKFVKDSDYAYKIINTRPIWAKKLRAWVGLEKEEASKIVERQDLEYFITSSEESITVFILASNHNGIDLKDLQDMGGKKLINACEKLINNDIIYIENGNAKSNVVNLLKGEFFRFSREALQKVIPVIIKNYNPEHSGNSRNYQYLGTETLSADFILECYQKVEELRSWYSKNAMKPENQGDNPFFLSMLMDTFTDKLISTSEVVQ